MPTPPPRAVCVVCATPLTPLQATAGERTCGSAACRWKLQSTPTHARCAVCERPLAPTELADGVCGPAAPSGDECRRRWFIARHREAERQRREHVDAEADALRGRAARASGIADAAAYPVAVIPSYQRRATRLPARRRRAFREHLARQVALAVERGAAAPPPPDADEPPLAPAVVATLGAACATCRGFCCRNGGERAYLSAERMQRFLAEHPGLGADDVVEAYMRHVGATTITGSCVFHRAGGCSLPREMRSDTCNRFYCGALHELQRALPANGSARIFAAAAEGRAIEAAAFIEAGRRRLVVLPS